MAESQKESEDGVNVKYADFKLVSSEGEIHPCRKHVLDSNSPVFRAMLEMDCVETKKGTMEVKDHDAKTVKSFIKYTHAQKAGSKIVELARRAVQPGEHIFRRQFDEVGYTPDLLLMAHLYQVDDLQIDCIEHLSKSLTKENVVESWTKASTIDCNKLKKAALDFLVRHIKQGDTFGIPGLYHQDHTSQLMEELHRHLSRHSQQGTDQGQIAKAMDIVEENVSMERMYSAFVVACKTGNLPLVNWMMDMPGKINFAIQEEDKNTCYTLGFWFACRGGHLNIVKCLLDIQQPDLLKVDAVINFTEARPFLTNDEVVRRSGQSTAFHVACSMGHHDVVQLLLELPEGTINFEASYLSIHNSYLCNFTGFMGACAEGRLTVVNLLLQLPEGGINIQAKNYIGWNGFMFACLNGYLSVIESFLELPQDRFNVDETTLNGGETGLDIAKRNRHQDIVDAILQYKNRAQ